MSQDNTFSPFPDILASKEQKQTDDYGLKYARAVWGTYQTNVTQYNLQRERYVINRQYAEGLQNFDKYKNRLGITNTSYLNLDFSPVNIIATTVDNLVGRLTNTGYKIQCNAIDPESKSRFDDYRNKLYADMFLKQYSDEIAAKTGVPMVTNKELPESDEEAELHLNMNYKEDASIAMEEALNFVFSSNMFERDKEKMIRDLITIKKCAYERFYDEENNIRGEYVDPVDLITPYSKYADFRNIPYVGVLKSYTIGELVVLNKGRWTDEQIFKMAKDNAGRNNNPAWKWGESWEGYYPNSNLSFNRPYYNFNIQVLRFYFLGLDPEVREFKQKRRRKYLNKVTEDFIPKDEDSKVITKKVQNLYGGYWVINSEYIFNYGLVKNIPREKIDGSYSPKATLPIKIIAPGLYDMQNKSLVERMIPHEDQINLANLKMQAIMIKAKPPGVAVDIRGLMDAAKGLGKNTEPLDIVKIYEQTGNYIYSSIAEEGDVINSRVVTELRGGLSDAMRDYLSVYQFEKNLINEVIGINPYIDPTAAKSETGLGVQDNAVQATNNALRPLFNEFLGLVEVIAKEMALMIQDSLEYNNQAFINAIGTYATKTLEYGRKLAMVQMGIKIELLPDEKEKMEVVQMMQLGIQSGTLMSSDVFRINQVMKQDVKLASKLLSFLENKNRKNKMQESMQLQQQNAEVQAQAAQQAAQAQLQATQQAEQIKQATLQLEYQLKNQFEEEQIRRALLLQGSKNEGMAVVAQINNDGKATVQHVANQGKEVVADKTNEGKLVHEAYKAAITPKETAKK